MAPGTRIVKIGALFLSQFGLLADQWWQTMIEEDVPDWCWRKNFRMS